jgi:hypothetical protein
MNPFRNQDPIDVPRGNILFPFALMGMYPICICCTCVGACMDYQEGMCASVDFFGDISAEEAWDKECEEEANKLVEATKEGLCKRK